MQSIPCSWPKNYFKTVNTRAALLFQREYCFIGFHVLHQKTRIHTKSTQGHIKETCIET